MHAYIHTYHACPYVGSYTWSTRWSGCQELTLCMKNGTSSNFSGSPTRKSAKTPAISADFHRLSCAFLYFT